ncbi:MAG: hypothetical protein ABW046_05350 [Actinoplanes sp.]
MALGLVVLGPSSAFADDPAPTVSVKATPGKKLCAITSPKLDEISGLVATSNGYVVINDSSPEDDHKKVFFLNTKCKITDEVSYSGKGPYDTEDLIVSPDNKTLWIADTGDNNYAKPDLRRSERGIVLWTMPLDGSKKPVLHRLKYPENDYHDAEALLLNGDGTPLIVTKEVGKPAYVYQPATALKTNNDAAVALKRVAQITISATETPGPPVARIGNKSISGGAIASGGGKVVLRTYTDALEWDVKNGDVLAALQGKPRTTGLPNETQGEAITYSADGKSFLTVSDMSGNSDADNNILSYTPATTVAAAKKASSTGDGKKWYSDLTIDDINYLVGAVGLLGLLLVGAGVLGIVQHRKRVGSAPPDDDDGDDDGFKNPLDGEPATELIGVGGPVAGQRNGVYGGARSGPAAPGGPAGAGVYGGANGGGAPRGNGVYGGGTPQYARPPGGGQPARPAGAGQSGQPARPAGGGQSGQPPRPAGGGQPPRPPQGPPPRGGQQPPARGGQPPQRGGPQPPQRGGQQPPARGGQQPPPARGGQQPPARGPQPPQRGGQQPPRPPQRGGPQPPGRNGVYGGQPQGQRPQGPGQGPRPPQGGQPPGRPDQGRQQSNADDYRRPDGRFDNPGPGRR